MARVLTCIAYDETTQQCVTEAWVEQGGFSDMLPTHGEANAVGIAFFGALVIVALAKRTLKPQR